MTNEEQFIRVAEWVLKKPDCCDWLGPDHEDDSLRHFEEVRASRGDIRLKVFRKRDYYSANIGTPNPSGPFVSTIPEMVAISQGLMADWMRRGKERYHKGPNSMTILYDWSCGY